MSATGSLTERGLRAVEDDERQKKSLIKNQA
jgi:hypothetical protein